MGSRQDLADRDCEYAGVRRSLAPSDLLPASGGSPLSCDLFEAEIVPWICYDMRLYRLSLRALLGQLRDCRNWGDRVA